MTKSELMNRLHELETEKKCKIEGIYWNSRKDEIQNAIDCLECADDTLDDYMTVLKVKYPNIHKTITENGNYKHHSHNRLYVYNTARVILA